MGSFWNDVAAVNWKEREEEKKTERRKRKSCFIGKKFGSNSGRIVLCNVSSVQNAARHPGGFSCSYSRCQMEWEVCLGAGEQKGRWEEVG